MDIVYVIGAGTTNANGIYEVQDTLVLGGPWYKQVGGSYAIYKVFISGFNWWAWVIGTTPGVYPADTIYASITITETNTVPNGLWERKFTGLTPNAKIVLKSDAEHIGSGTSSSRFLKTNYPITEGLTLGTTKLPAKAHLEPQEQDLSQHWGGI